MRNKSKIIKKYALRIFNYIFKATIIGLLTLFYWHFSYGHMITAYMANVVGILIFLIVGRIEVKQVYKKLGRCKSNKAIEKLIKKDVTSAKTALYLFYIFSLICSHILSLGAEIEVSAYVRDYFRVTGHGLILLFAIDNFLKYIVDDEEYVRKFHDECKCRIKDD
jgi:hypothetical protein